MNASTAVSTVSDTVSADEQEERIAQWLRDYIADVLSLPPEKIDPDASFNKLGLDSSSAVGMTGDLGDWLGQ